MLIRFANWELMLISFSQRCFRELRSLFSSRHRDTSILKVGIGRRALLLSVFKENRNNICSLECNIFYFHFLQGWIFGIKMVRCIKRLQLFCQGELLSFLVFPGFDYIGMLDNRIL